MRKLDKSEFNEKYILCLCECAAETDLMNILLENGKFPFSKEDLIGNVVYRKMAVKKN